MVGGTLEHDIFKQGAPPDGLEYFRFLLLPEIDAFRVAATFKIEYAFFSPSVLVIPNQSS
jgi:hypothetical protein